MKNEKQKMRFTDPELSLMKGLFAGNDELLYLIRKVMLQFSLTEAEEVTLRGAMTDKAHTLVCKLFLPELDPEAPLFQLTDMYIGLQGDLKAGVDQSLPYILVKELEIGYIAQQLRALKDPSLEQPISLKGMSKIKPTKSGQVKAWVNLSARNFLLSYIDSNIQQVKFLAGLKEETVEETKKRLEENSNK
jgi:hypothetical protein